MQTFLMAVSSHGARHNSHSTLDPKTKTASDSFHGAVRTPNTSLQRKQEKT